MAGRSVTATGGAYRSFPCLSFSADELITATVTWQDNNGNDIAETAPTSVVVDYIAGEGASSSSTISGCTFSGGTLTVPSFNPTDLAGVYRCRVRLYDADGNVYRSLRFYMSIESDDFGGGVEIVTVEALRRYLHDDLASANTLLLREEFADGDLAEAVIVPVRVWNETRPNFDTQSTEHFEFHEHWLMGAAGWLLRSNQHLLDRNRLKSPGDHLDDMQRAEVYKRTGDTLWSEYCQWMAVEKRAMDVMEGFDLV